MADSSINILFPFEDDLEKNYLFKTNKVTKDAIKSDLLLLLLTEKGERYYQPEYGTNLKKFIFEPNDSLTENDVTQDVKNTVGIFLPKLTIDKVTFSPNPEKENSISMLVEFIYSDDYFSEQDSFIINF